MSMNTLDGRDLARLFKTVPTAPADLQPGDIVVDDFGAMLVASVSPHKQMDQHGVVHDAFMILDSYRSGGSRLPGQFVAMIPRDVIDKRQLDGMLKYRAGELERAEKLDG